ncbi:SET_domain [Hexamita inflata]|uniref:SET domain n=1 Tax=Hexamita inflata TaxID=28002 RepID=A0AA86U1A9_9EUKA|nr:SET domain [Hexamita inflata]
MELQQYQLMKSKLIAYIGKCLDCDDIIDIFNTCLQQVLNLEYLIKGNSIMEGFTTQQLSNVFLVNALSKEVLLKQGINSLVIQELISKLTSKDFIMHFGYFYEETVKDENYQFSLFSPNDSLHEQNKIHYILIYYTNNNIHVFSRSLIIDCNNGIISNYCPQNERAYTNISDSLKSKLQINYPEFEKFKQLYYKQQPQQIFDDYIINIGSTIERLQLTATILVNALDYQEDKLNILSNIIKRKNINLDQLDTSVAQNQNSFKYSESTTYSQNINQESQQFQSSQSYSSNQSSYADPLTQNNVNTQQIISQQQYLVQPNKSQNQSVSQTFQDKDIINQPIQPDYSKFILSEVEQQFYSKIKLNNLEIDNLETQAFKSQYVQQLFKNAGRIQHYFFDQILTICQKYDQQLNINDEPNQFITQKCLNTFKLDQLIGQFCQSCKYKRTFIDISVAENVPTTQRQLYQIPVKINEADNNTENTGDFYHRKYDIESIDKVQLDQICNRSNLAVVGIHIIKKLLDTVNSENSQQIQPFSRQELVVSELNSNLLTDDVLVCSSLASIVLNSLNSQLKSKQCQCHMLCDLICPNWLDETQSSINKECDLKQHRNGDKYFICPNQMLTSSVINNLLNGQADKIYVSKSQNTALNNGCFVRKQLEAGEIIGKYYGYYSMSIENSDTFNTGYGANLILGRQIQEQIDAYISSLHMLDENKIQITRSDITINADLNYTLVKYINSVCYSPLAEFIQIITNSRPQLAIVALQDLYESREIQIDYSNSFLNKIQKLNCSCGQWFCKQPNTQFCIQISNNYILQFHFQLFHLNQMQYDMSTSHYRCILTQNENELVTTLFSIFINNEGNQIIYGTNNNRIMAKNLKKTKQDTQCVKFKMLLLNNLQKNKQCLTLPFLFYQGQFDINQYPLPIHISNYPNSFYQHKYNTKQFGYFFLVMSLKMKIYDPFYYDQQIISAQQYLFNCIRYVPMTYLEALILIEWMFDTVVTQCVNQFMFDLHNNINDNKQESNNIQFIQSDRPQVTFKRCKNGFTQLYRTALNEAKLFVINIIKDVHLKEIANVAQGFDKKISIDFSQWNNNKFDKCSFYQDINYMIDEYAVCTFDFRSEKSQEQLCCLYKEQTSQISNYYANHVFKEADVFQSILLCYSQASLKMQSYIFDKVNNISKSGSYTNQIDELRKLVNPKK